MSAQGNQSTIDTRMWGTFFHPPCLSSHFKYSTDNKPKTKPKVFR